MTLRKIIAQLVTMDDSQEHFLFTFVAFPDCRIAVLSRTNGSCSVLRASLCHAVCCVLSRESGPASEFKERKRTLYYSKYTRYNLADPVCLTQRQSSCTFRREKRTL